MRLRRQLCAALLAASLAPLLAVTAVALWLVPRATADAARGRADQAAAGAAANLVRACDALGDRAALLATQVQLQATLQGEDADLTGAAEDALAAVTPDSAGGSAAAVYAGDGRRLAATGTAGTALPASLPVPAPSCAAGRGGTRALLVESVVAPGAGDGAVAVVGVPLAPLVEDAAPAGGALSVLDGEGAVVAEAGGAWPDSWSTTVVPGPGEYGVAALGGAAPGPPWWLLAVAAVPAALALGLSVLLARVLTRPLDDLVSVAGDVAEGRLLEPAAGGAGGEGAPGDLEQVHLVLADLARALRESEADLVLARDVLVRGVGRFGSALDDSPDAGALLRGVAEAALVAGDAHVVVASFAEPPVDMAAAPGPAAGERGNRDRHAAGAGERPGRSVALHVTRTPRGGEAGTRRRGPLLLGGEQDAAVAPADLRAATSGLRRLRDLAARVEPGSPAVVVDDARDDVRDDVEEADGEPAAGWAALVPLRHAGSTLGHLGVVRRPARGAPDPGTLDSLVTLADHAVTALVTVHRLRQAATLSVTDPLTGVGNVRHLTATLAREVERATRFGHTLAVLMIDLDHFKQVNDNHGHARGDAVLVEVARRLQGCIREIDTLARYGGEEFCILLPETDLDGASVLAHRVVASVAAEVFRTPGEPDVALTVSVGIASYPVHGRTGAAVMRVADDALYEAKHEGRNRVVAASRDPDDGPVPLPAAGTGGAARRSASQTRTHLG